MLISWEWLSDYVKLDQPIEKVVDRWALSGLNHESTHEVILHQNLKKFIFLIMNYKEKNIEDGKK
ncbi:MAG: hypothetical protein ACKN82_01385, partial [Pirellula sp.]